MSLEKPSFTLVRSNPDNIHLMVPLFNRVFGKQLDASHFIRKYSTSFSNQGHFFSYMALDDAGECVAHQAAVPSKFDLNGRELWGGQSCDSVTAPECRGKGLFSLVGRKVDECLQVEGVDFVFGMANSLSSVATEKGLSYRPNHKMIGYKMKVNTLSLEKVSRKSGILYRPYLAWISAVLGRHGINRAIPNSCAGSGRLWMVHDAAFHEGKRKCGVQTIELNGVGMWLKVHGALHVGDMEFSQPGNIPGALKQLKSLCSRLGITEIVLQCSPGTPLEGRLTSQAEQFESWTVMAKPFREGLDLSTLSFCYGDIDTF